VDVSWGNGAGKGETVPIDQSTQLIPVYLFIAIIADGSPFRMKMLKGMGGPLRMKMLKGMGGPLCPHPLAGRLLALGRVNSVPRVQQDLGRIIDRDLRQGGARREFPHSLDTRFDVEFSVHQEMPQDSEDLPGKSDNCLIPPPSEGDTPEKAGEDGICCPTCRLGHLHQDPAETL
jgi:hypothetical protein